MPDQPPRPSSSLPFRPPPKAPLAAVSHQESTLPRKVPSEPRGIAGKHVVLGVTGSIAAYKAAALARLLVAEGVELDVVLTRSAREFVGAATFAGISGRPVLSDMFDPGLGGEVHVSLGARSDLVLVVPATADTLARFAGGRADDLLSATVLAASCPVLVAPAMHPTMWAHPALQHNVESLVASGRVGFIGPVEGEVASGDVGLGRMAEPEHILAHVVAALAGASLRGRHVVVTAGPTAEDIDPVRYVGNRSSGKMGFAIAERAARRGARVTLIAGPVSLPTPLGVDRVDVRSAEAMRTALWQALGSDLTGADALVMAAAVADFRPARPSTSKIKREAQGLVLELVPNPDLLAEVGHARRGDRPVLVGFALETDRDEKVIANARAKLMQKRVDLVIANHADEAIGRDDIRALMVGARSCEVIERAPKSVAAERIVDRLAVELGEGQE